MIVATAAVLAALTVIYRQARALVRWAQGLGRRLRAIDDVITRELEHNHGGSIKDDVHGMAVALGLLQRQVTEQGKQHDADVQRLRALIDFHHPDGGGPTERKM